MNIWIVGDLHGSAKPVQDFYVNTLQEEEDADNWLICLGDFGGFYYFNWRDHKFKDELCQLPIKYFVIRGNHEARAGDTAAYDNYTGWEEVDCFGGKCLREVSYPNIYYAEDSGGIYNIAGRKTLVIPGAYSVDKWYRLQQDWAWFSGEQLTPLEMTDLSAAAEGQHFDLVLSHTCPRQYQPTDLFLGVINQASVDSTMEIWMDSLLNRMTFGIWCFAHYHRDRIEAPHIEMFFGEVENLETIEDRWRRYDETGELDWWLPLSPKMERIMNK